MAEADPSFFVNMHEAKTKLSQLVDQVENGGLAEVVIARNGRPVAKLVPYVPAKKAITFGVAKGKYRLPDDWDADDEIIARMFNGEARVSEGARD